MTIHGGPYLRFVRLRQSGEEFRCLDDHAVETVSALDGLFEKGGRALISDNERLTRRTRSFIVEVDDLGQLDEARKYAHECLLLAIGLPSRTLDDVTSDRQSVGGVPLPDHFHDGVVRQRLADLLDAV